jgi:hypothetical protein
MHPTLPVHLIMAEGRITVPKVARSQTSSYLFCGRSACGLSLTLAADDAGLGRRSPSHTDANVRSASTAAGEIGKGDSEDSNLCEANSRGGVLIFRKPSIAICPTIEANPANRVAHLTGDTQSNIQSNCGRVAFAHGRLALPVIGSICTKGVVYWERSWPGR